MENSYQHIEIERLEVLSSYNILDTDNDPLLDSMTLLVSQLCQTPICLISLIDEKRQWFKSKVGIEAKETSRDIAFCHYAIHGNSIMEVQDAKEDDRFRNNPLVNTDPNIRFYAGVPLINSQGYALGTLCVIDRKPRKLDSLQISTLTVFGKFVMEYFEKKLQTNKAEHAIAIKQDIMHLVGNEVKDPMRDIIRHMKKFDLKNKISNQDISILKTMTNKLNGSITKLITLGKPNEPVIKGYEFSYIKLINEINKDVNSQHGIDIHICNDAAIPANLIGDPVRLRQAIDKLINICVKVFNASNISVTTEILLEDLEYLELEINVTGSNTNKLSILDDNYKLIVATDLISDMGSDLRRVQGSDYQFIFNVNLKKAPNDKGQFNNENSLKGLRALIVDDTIMNRFVAGKFLTNSGMYYNEASTGTEAVNMFMKHYYDIILIDIQMPDMDGYTTIEKIRNLEITASKSVPIIAIANAESIENKMAIKLAGADDIFIKPFDSNDLIKMIHKHLYTTN